MGDRVLRRSLVAEVRSRAGLTQEELAERAGLSVRGLRDLERGAVRRPHRSTLLALGAALGLDDEGRERLVAHYRRPPSEDPADGTWLDRPAAALPPLPAQLPAAPPVLVGREEERRRLDRLHLEGRDRVVAVVLDGPGGVGKTSLATAWGLDHRDDFPDGQLFVDLQGHASSSPVDPAVVLGRFLRSLGVPSSQVPAAVEERQALWRSVLADRRVLVVLDNAASPAQVRPLIPAAPGVLVLVTSRSRLRGLILDGADRVTVGPLSESSSARLLGRLVDGDAADATHAASIIEHCGGLPLAITVAASRARDGAGLQGVATQLKRSGGLSLGYCNDDVTDLDAVLSWSLAALDEDTSRILAHLGCHLGVDLTTASALALSGQDVRSVEVGLERLVDAHLLETHEYGRLHFHDLVRQFARRHAATTLTDSERASARARLVDAMTGTAAAAAHRFEPVAAHLLPMPRDPAELGSERFESRDDAIAWLEAERANLVATAEAASAERPLHAQQLNALLFRYLLVLGHRDDAATFATHALEAARHRGDASGEAKVLCDLGALHTLQGDSERAVVVELRARRLAARSGNRVEELRAQLYLGNSFGQLGRYRRSIAHLESALAAGDEGLPRIFVAALNGIADGHCRLGEYALAEPYLRQSVALAVESENLDSEATALRLLGECHISSGRLADAGPVLQRALATARRAASVEGACRTLCQLVRLRLRTGEVDEALTAVRRALELAERDGNPDLRAEVLSLRQEALRQGAQPAPSGVPDPARP